MPLQWLPLQERQQQQRSPYSQVLTPRQGAGAAMGSIPQGEGFMERQQRLQEVEAERKYQEKIMKLQHEQEMEKAKFTAGMQGDTQKQQATMRDVVAQAEQQGAQRQQIEDNPEPAAKEMYGLMKTLPDEAKQQLLQQIFTQTSGGGTISSGGKTIEIPGKHNPIANVFLEKGWAMFDAKGNVSLSEGKREFEKNTFEIVEKGGKVYKLNTATGDEKILGSTAEPEGVVNAINKEANEKALALSKEGKVSFEDAKYDALIDNGVDPEIAADLAKVKEIPKNPNEINWFKDAYKIAVDWVKGRKPKEATKEDWEKAAGKIAGAGEGAFKEDNVSALVPIISDDVTPAERAYLKGQGASNSDINEAIKRKGSK